MAAALDRGSRVPLAVLGALSLALNAALAAWIMANPAAPVRATAEGKARPAEPASLPPGVVVARQANTAYSKADLASLVGELESAGLSRSLARATVSELVRGQFARRRADLLFPPGAPFFRQGEAALSPERRAELLALRDQEQEWLRDVVGHELSPDDPELQRMLAKRYLNFTTPEKFAAVSKLWNDYALLQEKVWQQQNAANARQPRASSWRPMSEVMAERRAMAEAERADIEQLLSPAELEAYDKVNSNSTQRLRLAMAASDVSDDEFATLLEAQREYDKTANFLPSSPYGMQLSGQFPDELAQQDEYLARAQAVLGEKRMEELLAKSASGYREIAATAREHGVPPAKAFEAWKVQRDTQAALVRLLSDPSLSDEQKQQGYTALRADALARSVQLLGQDAVDRYVKTHTSFHYVDAGPTYMVPFPVLLPHHTKPTRRP